MTSKRLEETIARLRTDFVERLPGELDEVMRFYAPAVASPPDMEALREVVVIAHRIAGSGATFGFPEISEFGRALEVRARLPLERGQVDADDRHELAQLVEQLTQAIRDLPEIKEI